MPNTSPSPQRRRLRHPLVLVALAVLIIAAAAGAYWFQPWKLFTNTTVDEALPTIAATSVPSGAAPRTEQPQVLSQGSFVSHEHDTTGTAKLLRLPDGSLMVRVENLDTSDGPELHLLLSDAPVVDGKDGGNVFKEARNVDLGPLKGNRGNANYPVPGDVDVSGLNSVGIWCKRFSASFGAAELSAPPGGS